LQNAPKRLTATAQNLHGGAVLKTLGPHRRAIELLDVVAKLLLRIADSPKASRTALNMEHQEEISTTTTMLPASATADRISALASHVSPTPAQCNLAKCVQALAGRRIDAPS